MSLTVVGARYPNRDGSDRMFEILLCQPGERVELRPEPKNKKDERAIAVYSARGVQIGYLTAERCGWIGGLIKSGRDYRVVFQQAAQSCAWIRIAFDGAEPTLPANVADSARDDPHVDYDPGFLPDEIWPDE